MIIDPAIDQSLMMTYLQIAYTCGVEEINNAEPVEKTLLLDRLRKGGVHRAGAVF